MPPFPITSALLGFLASSATACFWRIAVQLRSLQPAKDTLPASAW